MGSLRSLHRQLREIRESSSEEFTPETRVEIAGSWTSISGTAGEDVFVGDFVHSGSDFVFTKVSATDTPKLIFGVVLSTRRTHQGTEVDVAISGKILVTAKEFETYPVGSSLYLSEFKGKMSSTVPTQPGSFIRPIGMKLSKSTIMFSP